MADTNDFFNSYLPAKLQDDPSLQDIGKIFRFAIDGAGTWTLNLSQLTVAENDEGPADCTITSDKASWDKLITNPSSAMTLFMMGKIKADNLGLATQLQKILA